MPITAVDTHVHCWDLQRTRYSWLDRVPELNRSFALDELEPSRLSVHVSEGVLVQAANSLDDTAWMLKTAAEHPWIKGIVGWLPLQNPGETSRLLENRFKSTVLFKGVRHLIHDEADPAWLLQPQVMDSLKLISQAGLSFDFVGVKLQHVETALKVGERIPDLKLVFDHLNQPPSEESAFEQWRLLMIEAAKNPNFYAKISGLGKGAGWTEDDIRPAVEFVLESFGNDRCFVGGDWPVCLLAGTYTDTWEKYRSVFGKLLSEDAQEKLLSVNARLFYRL